MTVSATIGSLERLQQLYRSGYSDRFLDDALSKIVDRQISRDEADLARVDAELRDLEERFQMSSEVFWRKYQEGVLGDSADFMEWNVFCNMKRRISARLAILRER